MKRVLIVVTALFVSCAILCSCNNNSPLSASTDSGDMKQDVLSNQSNNLTQETGSQSLKSNDENKQNNLKSENSKNGNKNKDSHSTGNSAIDSNDTKQNNDRNNKNELTDIFISDQPLAGFKSTIYDYDYILENNVITPPIVTATGYDGTNGIDIIQAKK